MFSLQVSNIKMMNENPLAHIIIRSIIISKQKVIRLTVCM